MADPTTVPPSAHGPNEPSAAPLGPVLEIGSGRLRGTVARGGAVHAWRGIPYAEPPVGARRFAAPVPHRGWTGVRDATVSGRAAPQIPALRPGPLGIWLSARRSRSENCLTLDVWAPAAAGPARAVVVWFHGGSFNSGSGSLYDGGRLVEEGDVVFVAVNYRLGGLGFVDFADAVGGDDARIVSNPGLRDQVAALAWVRDHIAAFGGDPQRVTIAGESAGSACVTLLATSPAARGLFHGVIAQSGALTLAVDREDAARTGREVLGELNVGPERIDELWRRPASAFVRATARVQARRSGSLVTRPWWDDDLLPESLAAAYGAVAPVPLMIGTNADEHRIFTRLRRDIMPLTREALATSLVESLGTGHAARVLAEYPDDRDGLNDLGSDFVFAMPSVHLAERHAERAPTWVYRFALPSRLPGMGAFHAIELLMLFPLAERAERVTFGPPDPARDELAAALRRDWLAFVRDGRPTADWPTYEPTGDRATSVWDLPRRVDRDPRAARRNAWDGRDAVIH